VYRALHTGDEVVRMLSARRGFVISKNLTVQSWLEVASWFSWVGLQSKLWIYKKKGQSENVHCITILASTPKSEVWPLKMAPEKSELSGVNKYPLCRQHICCLAGCLHHYGDSPHSWVAGLGFPTQKRRYSSKVPHYLFNLSSTLHCVEKHL
jgi:hypothetical protein